MVEGTAALEGRDRDWLRFGGMGLKEGARARGAASVADLAGEGGKISSQERSDDSRGASSRLPTLRGHRLKREGQKLEARRRWCVQVSSCLTSMSISAIFERHGDRYSKARTLTQATSKTTRKGGAASPRPVAARWTARGRRSAEDQYVCGPRYAAGAPALCAGACDASGRSKASASKRAALSGRRPLDRAGARPVWDAGASLVGPTRAHAPDRRGDAPALAFARHAGAFDSHEQGAQQGARAPAGHRLHRSVPRRTTPDAAAGAKRDGLRAQQPPAPSSKARSGAAGSNLGRPVWLGATGGPCLSGDRAPALCRAPYLAREHGLEAPRPRANRGAGRLTGRVTHVAVTAIASVSGAWA